MFVYKVKLFLLRRKYRKLNQHNKTQIKNLCNINNIEVGKNTYGFITITDCSPSNSKLRIGSYCSIASDVKFILGGEHQINSISTYPFKYQIFGKGREANSKGDIVVKDDVWIGLNAVIMSGVTIGQGAIIGAGAIVTKNIEPYSIAVGVPAKVIKYRFDEDLRNKLLSIDIVSLFDKIKEEDLNLIYEELTMEKLNQIMEKING